MIGNRKRLFVLLAMLLSIAGPGGAVAATQNDGGSGADAGNTFDLATPIPASGLHAGELNRAAGDRDDFYRFPVAAGASLSVLITTSATSTDPVRILDPNGVPVDVGVRTSGVNAVSSVAFTHENLMRLTIYRAAVAGDYRLHLRAEQFNTRTYTICFMNCEGPRKAGIDMIFGGSLKQTHTSVLLVPPAHGDLGDPLGPTVKDYIDATLRGMHRWVSSMDEFATKYPQFSYLRDIEVDIEIFDKANPVDPVGYDVVIGYVAAGPAFRGVATSTIETQRDLRAFGLGTARFSGRAIALSLFGASPRAGQVMWDFPEVIDLEIVTMHEFGHTFGLGHTTTWHETLGFDLMNSPAAFVYGNGSPVGDGGAHTPMTCLSSLDLFGMAHLYRWLESPSGNWEPSWGRVSAPSTMPYEWFCGNP